MHVAILHGRQSSHYTDIGSIIYAGKMGQDGKIKQNSVINSKTNVQVITWSKTSAKMGKKIWAQSQMAAS